MARKEKKPADKTRAQMPKWMFETRTHRWHEAGLGEEIAVERPGRTSPPYPGHGMTPGQVLREDAELEGQLSGADPAEFPRMSKVFGVGREQSRDTIFDIALEAVLDGIERRFVKS